MNFSQINTITKEEILTKISEEELWKYYCHNFKEVGKLFISELRTDNTPTCGLYLSNSDILYYKDFGTGEHYDIFNYIIKKYNCSYHESLNIVSSDFKISEIKNNIDPEIILSNDTIKLKEKSKIEVFNQPFNLTDYNYWNQYEITLEQLAFWQISSLKAYYLIKGNNRWLFSCTRNNPIYHYNFNDKEKIYRPYANVGKFLYLGEGLLIEGYEQLSKTGDLLIITKSYKDVICLYNSNYSAISFNSESKFIPNEIINELSSRFKQIMILYDNDAVGRNNAKLLQTRFNFKVLEIPIKSDCKDYSDYIKKFKLKEGKKLLKKLIYV